MLGTTLQGPVVALSGECEICVVGSCVFAIFRRLALHLQPRAEPTPVETVAPPSTCASRKREARQPIALARITVLGQAASGPEFYFTLNSRSNSLFWSLLRISSRLSKSFLPFAMPSSHFTYPRLR